MKCTKQNVSKCTKQYVFMYVYKKIYVVSVMYRYLLKAWMKDLA